MQLVNFQYVHLTDWRFVPARPDKRRWKLTLNPLSFTRWRMLNDPDLLTIHIESLTGALIDPRRFIGDRGVIRILDRPSGKFGSGPLQIEIVPDSEL